MSEYVPVPVRGGILCPKNTVIRVVTQRGKIKRIDCAEEGLHEKNGTFSSGG